MRPDATWRVVIVAGLVAAGTSAAQAQLVAGVADPKATNCALYDFATGEWTPLFGGFSVHGLAADDASRTLYISDGLQLRRWSFDNLDTGVPPAVVGAYSPTSRIYALAYDAEAAVLYGVRLTNEGIDRIDPATAALTRVMTYPNTEYDFTGLDWNPADGLLYATSDDMDPHGPGLFRIDLEAQTITKVAPYPVAVGVGGDVDGLAIGAVGAGPTRAYLVPDQPGEVGVLALPGGATLAPIANPWQVASSDGAACWSAGLAAGPARADLAVTIIDAPDPVVPPGGDVAYTVRVENLGPVAASGVTAQATVPAGTTFVSAGAPASHAAGVVSAALGAMAPGAVKTFAYTVRTAAAGSIVANASAAAASPPDPVASNSVASATTTVRQPVADLSVAVASTADCTVPAGGTLGYTATVTNAGPEAGTGVRLAWTLPEGATLLSTVPAATVAGGVATRTVGALAPGASASLAITVRTGTPGAYAAAAEATATVADPAPANNRVVRTVRTITPVPATAPARGVLSTVAGSPTGEVAGLERARFVSPLARPWPSGTGRNWIMAAPTDAPAGTETVLIVGDADGYRVVAQEGVTTLPWGVAVGSGSAPFDPVQGVNDLGRYAFSGADAAGNGYVVCDDGFDLVAVARQGGTIPGLPATVQFGHARGSASVADDGSVSFVHALQGSGVTAANDAALFAADGATLVAREGVTVPTGQATGPFAYAGFDVGAAVGLGFFRAPAGPGWIAAANVNASTTTPPPGGRDRVLISGGAVVVQENTPAAGFASPARDGVPFEAAAIGAGGAWLAIGSNADGVAWVLRGVGAAGAAVARSGDPVTPGSSERWADASAGQPFFAASPSGSGGWLVGGRTTRLDASSDTVLVLDGAAVVLRENDPVDLDADGAFNDGVYVRAFRAGGAFLAEGGVLHALVELRNESAALCGGPDVAAGEALVRVALAPPCASTDFDGDGDEGTDADIETFFAAIGGNSCATCGSTDFDGDGDEGTDADIEAFFRVVGGGGCAP